MQAFRQQGLIAVMKNMEPTIYKAASSFQFYLHSQFPFTSKSLLYPLHNFWQCPSSVLAFSRPLPIPLGDLPLLPLHFGPSLGPLLSATRRTMVTRSTESRLSPRSLLLTRVSHLNTPRWAFLSIQSMSVGEIPISYCGIVATHVFFVSKDLVSQCAFFVSVLTRDMM